MPNRRHVEARRIERVSVVGQSLREYRAGRRSKFKAQI